MASLILLKIAAQEVLTELAEREYSSIYQEKVRWIQIVNECAEKYNITFLQVAETVNDELRCIHNLPGEMPSTAKIKQSRSSELWEDFAMIHWGYLEWYQKGDPECSMAYAKIKKMEEKIKLHNIENSYVKDKEDQ